MYLSCVGVVAQPWRRAETLVYLWFLCGPFAARGAKGEAEYPSVGWEVSVSFLRSASGSRHGARVAARSAGRLPTQRKAKVRF